MSGRPAAGFQGSVNFAERDSVRARASPNTGFMALPLSEAPEPKRETVSTPAAMNTSPSPERIACAAIRMV